MLRCFDSVVAAALPASPVCLGYVDGAWPTYHELVGRRFVVPITVTGVHRIAQAGRRGLDHPVIVDCEAGDLSPAQAATWALEELRAGHRPTIYGGQDSIDATIYYLRRQRVRAELVDYFLADWIQVAPRLDQLKWPRDLRANLCGWQFADSIPSRGHSVDASVVRVKWAVRHGLRAS